MLYSQQTLRVFSQPINLTINTHNILNWIIALRVPSIVALI
jgi:hypothetical protein